MDDKYLKFDSMSLIGWAIKIMIYSRFQTRFKDHLVLIEENKEIKSEKRDSFNLEFVVNLGP